MTELGVTDAAFDRTIEEDVVDQAIDEMTSGYRGPYLRIHDARWWRKEEDRQIVCIEANRHLLVLKETGSDREGHPYEICHHRYNEGGAAHRTRDTFHHLSQALRRIAELVEEQKF